MFRREAREGLNHRVQQHRLRPVLDLGAGRRQQPVVSFLLGGPELIDRLKSVRSPHGRCEGIREGRGDRQSAQSRLPPTGLDMSPDRGLVGGAHRDRRGGGDKVVMADGAPHK
jgi:hypothetical protein